MPTGTLVLPAVSDVKIGVQYGANGTEYTGTLQYVPLGVVGDLASRVLTAAKNIAAALNLGQTPSIPTSRTYRRAVLSMSAPRDGALPACVVAPTPGVGASKTKALRWLETIYPITVMVADTQGGSVIVGDEWRLTWADRMWEALDTADWSAAGVPEQVDINAEPLVQLDLSAFDQAGLWVASVPIQVVCREPY